MEEITSDQIISKEELEERIAFKKGELEMLEYALKIKNGEIKYGS